MTVTLADVAARAQVSPATVSRVLNGNYPVAAATRERVLRAVDDLDYVLNGPASALAAATSDLVGILVNDIADPFFGIMASAVQSEIGGPGGRAGGERLAVVCNTGGSPERELTYLTLLQRQRAAAVVLTGGAVEDAEHAAAVAGKLRRLADAGSRVVLCGRPPAPGTDAVALTFDNRGGGRRITEHLISLGHRRIGYIAGPQERTTTRHRLEGHREALAAHGVEDDPALTVHGRYDRRSGHDGTVELLRRDPSLTAVVAANDTVAIGACAALRGAGLRIPDDVSVAGFDDLPFSGDAVPALTTVRLPLYEAGARAGRVAMGKEEPPPGDVATVRGELVVRKSTGVPR
ncbi:LacI family transcriptional regulator [Streptomyces alfalfae]|uniref:LacI family DNA-binding transcriptional regulator n=1 Tax=Streptomyces alfalfae TaxID=1642299 RepID=A0A1P8TKZ2_9ACTN|nr:LacI family DNA-binding transcriptional regulator [Streptomyces alfalfae]AYA18655.1 LacI family transcriptional regulator [Streptomyces fradiae]APY88258.1 LacI family transcriptional regulator [Streptomyces alfalfae]QQC89380.1 LacI family DNA-binding transcriptional regulator [Streptomyces alfalfae]QUI31831.1 LacI family DNA-binding transcriptional regulator [Streptomyces alfalfae]RXX46465.1 LacI family transcriptional regulator [Streptomyces alfalfae]